MPYTAPPPPSAAAAYPGPPAATVIQGGWRLTVVQGADAGQSYALGAQARLGRNPDNEIKLSDSQASRYHALIRRQQTDYVIIDQGSGNGTYVNGQLIHKPTPLAIGDVITIGNTQMKVG
jgi:pSer/pThr/pTyr-binding forkhead associated (FHA) protein